MPKRPTMTEEEARRWRQRLKEDSEWSDFEFACWKLDHPIVIRCKATGRVLAVI